MIIKQPLAEIWFQGKNLGKSGKDRSEGVEEYVTFSGKIESVGFIITLGLQKTKIKFSILVTLCIIYEKACWSVDSLSPKPGDYCL